MSQQIKSAVFSLALLLGSQVGTAETCNKLVSELGAQAKVRTLIYEVATNSLSGWSGYSTGRLIALSGGGLQSAEPGRQLFSDRTEPCQGTGCQMQTFAASKPDLLSVALGESAMTLTFHTWNYSSVVNITCQGRTLFGRQGNEFHVLTFR